MLSIKDTIFFENSFWVGVFERNDKKGYAVLRHVFGAEPTNPEIYHFVLHEYSALHFGEGEKLDLHIKRVNPKRLQREVRREMEKAKEIMKPSTLAQDYMREELEKNKKEKKRTKSADKQLRKEKKFAIKQKKKKGKHQGH